MQKTRLFVVDDNMNMVNMIREYFSKHPDISVTLEAYDGKDAVRMVDKKQDEYDIILLDLVMPTKDGICVLEQLNKKQIDKKVIIITSYNTQDLIKYVNGRE